MPYRIQTPSGEGHYYGDVSRLNAPYNPSPGLYQYPSDGLGANMTQHFYGDLSNLNAPYDPVPLQGLVALGADDPKYPWKKNSKDTLYLQQDVNEGLVADGKCPIVEDGYLGPATCGAIQYFINKGAFTADVLPSTCSGHTAEFISPKSKPCGSSGGGGGSSSPSTTEVVTEAGMGGGEMPTWVWGLLLGGAAIGLAMYLKKNKR